MKFAPEINLTSHIIRRYTDHEITIGESTYNQSIIVSPHQILAWAPQTPQGLTAEDALPLLALQPEVILVGIGPRFRLLPANILAKFTEQGLSAEVMTTQAACRTYNLLANEGREVVAGLLIVNTP